MSTRLRYQIRGGESVELTITRDSMVIGRANGCDVVVDAPGILDRHFRLLAHDGRWSIEDLTDGRTHVEASGDVHLVLGRRMLRAGERLFIGFQTKPVFEAWLIEPSAAAPSPPPIAAAAAHVDDLVELRGHLGAQGEQVERLRAELVAAELSAARALSRQAVDYEALLRAERHKRQGAEASCESLRSELDAQLETIEALRRELVEERAGRARTHDDVLAAMRRANELAQRVCELEVVIEELQRHRDGRS